ncbi:LamB/YcsF family protein, partial [Variovorax sp. Varisp62]|uniref:LamB/YcsF family protein n=1 Tax=Variovorax sp. Varisp62 TaxID=3243049 RepID=UPI0039B6B5D1
GVERAVRLHVANRGADRAYTPQGTLVSRREPGAVLHDADEVAERMLRLATEGVVTAIDGSTVRIEAESVCVHGDSPGAVEMARQVRARLEQAGVTIRPFVDAA